MRRREKKRGGERRREKAREKEKEGKGEEEKESKRVMIERQNSAEREGSIGDAIADEVDKQKPS